MLRRWLQEERLKKEKTHDDVAREAGIKRAYYTMIENATRDPSVKVAKRIAHVLGFDWIIFFDSQSNVTTHGLAALNNMPNDNASTHRFNEKE